MGHSRRPWTQALIVSTCLAREETFLSWRSSSLSWAVRLRDLGVGEVEVDAGAAEDGQDEQGGPGSDADGDDGRVRPAAAGVRKVDEAGGSACPAARPGG